LVFCCSKRQKFEQNQTANLDADDPVDDDDDDDSSNDSDSEDDSVLLAELAKIRKERAAEQARKVELGTIFGILFSLYTSGLFLNFFL